VVFSGVVEAGSICFAALSLDRSNSLPRDSAHATGCLVEPSSKVMLLVVGGQPFSLLITYVCERDVDGRRRRNLPGSPRSIANEDLES
jgi:hypothetical protein